jgi:hypothetical protein
MTPQHQRTRSYRGRHRKPAQPQRVVVPVVTLAALSVGGVAVANAVNGPTPAHVAAAAVIAPHVAAATPSPAPTRVTLPAAVHRVAKQRPHRAVRPDSLRIVDVHGPCYVQVNAADGRLLLQQIMRQGQKVSFRHHGLAVTLGSAGAVRVAIDGHAAKRLGRPGQVRTFRVR